MENNITVLIVDDHPLFLRGVKDAIEDGSSINVVGQAGSGEEAIRLFEELSPTVVVTDVDMPEMDGLQLARALRERDPKARIVVLTMHCEERIFAQAVDVGVNAYITKDKIVDEIVEGITTAASGGYYIPPSLSKLVMRYSQQSAMRGRQESRFGCLTRAEREVLRRVAENQTSKEIAADLNVSVRTISTHRNSIAKKLDLGGSMPLVNFALIHRDEIAELP